MKGEIRDFLTDILGYSAKAKELAAIVQKENLGKMAMESMALVYCLGIIGEAVKHIPQNVREKYPAKWKKVAGMRDKLVHDYWSTDFEIILEAINKDLPPFLETVNLVFDEIDNQ